MHKTACECSRLLLVGATKHLLSARFDVLLSPNHMLEDSETDPTPSQRKRLLPVKEIVTENQCTLKSSSWKLGVARQEDAKDCELYLHRILH